VSGLLKAAIVLLVIVVAVLGVALVVVRRRETHRAKKQAQRRAEVRRFEDESSFDWILIPCAGREAAEAKARRRQATESSDVAWIFLQVDGVWVAKRTPTDPTLYPPEPRERLWSKFLSGLLGEWIDHGSPT
jgi:hypothetical protein